jgi:metal-dependent hydrolase (beta-lactamase superfamily II)
LRQRIPQLRAIYRQVGARPERHLYLFGSHSHLDHTEGFDQAAVLRSAQPPPYLRQPAIPASARLQLRIFSHEVAREVHAQTWIFFGVMPAH